MPAKYTHKHLTRLTEMLSQPSSNDSVMLKFMERTIENINTCLAGQYTLYKLLIERGIVTEAELISRLKDDKNLPQRKLGIEILQDMLAPSWEDKIDFEKTAEQLLDETLSKIDKLILPEHWKEEGVEPPNSTAIRLSHATCRKIYDNHKILPKVIACTRDNGIYLRYENSGKSLVIEAYNDGDIGTLVIDDNKKETLYSEDIYNMCFDNSLKIFTEK